MRAVRLVVILAASVAWATSLAHAAQTAPAGRASAEAGATAGGPVDDGGTSEIRAPEAPDSPRASARAFLDLAMRKGDYAAAARYLVIPRTLADRGPELAERMRAVIEHWVIIDLDAVSPLSGGNPNDGLPEGVDRLGTLPPRSGATTPIYIVRRQDKSGTWWALSRETVLRIDEWYDALPDRWIREWLPESLQRHGPLGLLRWQWVALPALVALAFLIGRLLGALVTRLLRRAFSRTRTAWDDRLLTRVEPAVRLFVAALGATALVPFLALLAGPQRAVNLLLGATFTSAVFWGLWLSVDVWRLFLMARPWAANNASTRSLLSVALNFVKLFIAVAAVLTVLAVLGYPVATVVAGLGIGGIALAFGAQKTVENLFGSVALAVDQPFRVGDLVKIEDFVGNVERIGMRSTQIRTADRTTITMPNGKLSELRIEGFGTRDRIRFATTVSLVYGAAEAQVRQVVLEVERLLRSTPEVWKDAIITRVANLGSSSIDVEVMCWIDSPDFDLFGRVRQDLFLGILRIVQDAGTRLAFPTSTVRVERDA
jgi:MscS family membrane protein